jgi:hypothetical protein
MASDAGVMRYIDKGSFKSLTNLGGHQKGAGSLG